MRYFIYLSYDGRNYCGWQNQPNGISVQQRLEESLSILLRTPLSITGAGRTDAGVHASFMVAHVDIENDVDCTFLTEKLNRILPPDIAVSRIVPVHPEAHARFDATARTYHYFISTNKDPFQYPFSYRIGRPLDFKQMNMAAAILLNHTDFTSFSKLHTDTKTNNCKVTSAHWQQDGSRWIFTITADRFLRNMVRAIVGTLLEVGRGKKTVTDFENIILEKDRGKAGSSAPAQGLFLADIQYPEHIFKL